MIIETKTFVHHYSPERRDESGTVVRTIVFRNAGDPYMRCKEEVDVIYDKVRRLLNTVDTWLEYSLDDDIKNETVQALRISINKTLTIVTKDIKELIYHYQVTDRDDVDAINDVAVQLQEIADDIFKSYIMQ